MTPRRPFSIALALGLVASFATTAAADARVAYVYPAGGRQGTTVRATMAGQSLAGVKSVHVSGTGVTATLVEQEKFLNGRETIDARDTLQKFQERRRRGERLTPEELATAEDLQKKLASFARRQANPAIGEFLTVEFTIAPDAAPGDRGVRLLTAQGLSNAVTFAVGTLPESTEPDWKSTPRGRTGQEPPADRTTVERPITLPTTVNGQIPPGGTDRFRFTAREGQTIVVVVRARALIPYIADAVPGWFQAVVVLYDAKGREVAYADDYRFQPDPVLSYRIPVSGEYVLELKDSLYRGREDFVYRIDVGELPFVTSIFPLGGKVGSRTACTVTGWNLPFTELPLDLQGVPPGIRPFAPGRIENPVSYAADVLPETVEAEPNDAPEAAQALTWPIVVNGRIDKPGDVDSFRIGGRGSDRLVAEVLARRLDSPVDAWLTVTDRAGRPLGKSDDADDKGRGLETHHADPYVGLTLAAGGSLLVRVGDTQNGGGPAYGYRLRIGTARPDFDLRITPSSVNLLGGASVPLTVHAMRRDGFAGEIVVTLKEAPRGFTLTGARVGEKQDKATFTLNAPAWEATEPFPIVLEGRATIEGREVVRTAVPADDVMQAFLYRHLVPAKDLLVAVVGKSRTAGVARVLTPTPVKIPVGGTARVEVSLPTVPAGVRLEYELAEAPEGVTLRSADPIEGGVALVLRAEAGAAKVGAKGNLVFKVKASRAPAGAAAPGGNRGQPVGALPAVPYELVAK